MSQPAVADPQVPAVGTDRRLADLAKRINDSHSSVGLSVVSALRYAIEAGEGLNEVFDLLKTGEFDSWCAQNVFLTRATIGRYRRIAEHKNLLPAEIFNPHIDEIGRFQNASINRAIKYLNSIDVQDKRRRGPKELLDQADVAALIEKGLTLTQVAQVFGVAESTVRLAVMPESQRRAARAKKNREAKKTRDAARAEVNRRIMSATADDLGEAYSLLRKCLQKLQIAYDHSPSKLQRKEISTAMRRLADAEDLMIRASRERVGGTI